MRQETIEEGNALLLKIRKHKELLDAISGDKIKCYSGIGISISNTVLFNVGTDGEVKYCNNYLIAREAISEELKQDVEMLKFKYESILKKKISKLQKEFDNLKD
jgi:hypothetical protein